MTLKLNERYPGRFNNPSPGYPQGSFKNRTAPAAKDGSYLEQDWANDKEGFFQSIISKAAITPDGSVDKVGSSQLFSALIRLIQNQEGVAYVTAGTPGAFTIAPTPALTAYAINQLFQVTFNAAGGVTPTINVSGLGIKSLKQFNSAGVKIAAIIASGQTSDVFYDGTDFVLLDQLPNSSGVTQAKFDNSTNLATTAFVQGVGLKLNNNYVVTGNTTLTAATHAGAMVVGSSVSSFTVTLPLASTMPAGASIKFLNYGGGTMFLVGGGSDTIQNPFTNIAQLAIQQGSWFTLVSTGSNGWYVSDGMQLAAITSSFKNLSGSANGISAAASFSADELVLKSNYGAYTTLRSVTISPSLSSSGVNGLDTGTSAASTWYSVWVIWNGTTIAGLFSLSATNPALPSGYTHSARVGWVRSDGTANKYPLSFVQSGRSWRYKVSPGTNVLGTPVMSSGTAGNIATPTYSAVSISAFVPPTAIKITVSANSFITNGLLVAHPNPNAGPASNSAATNMPLIFQSVGSSGGATTTSVDMIIESGSIYWASNSVNGVLACFGYEDSL